MHYKLKSNIKTKTILALFLVIILICAVGFVLNLAIVGIFYNFIYSYDLFAMIKMISSGVVGLLIFIFILVYTAKIIIDSISVVKVEEVEVIIPVEKKETIQEITSDEKKEEIKNIEAPADSSAEDSGVDSEKTAVEDEK